MERVMIERAIFEFTHDGKLFEIFEHGLIKVSKSVFPADAQIVINRIPTRISEERAVSALLAERLTCSSGATDIWGRDLSEAEVKLIHAHYARTIDS